MINVSQTFVMKRINSLIHQYPNLIHFLVNSPQKMEFLCCKHDDGTPYYGVRFQSADDLEKSCIKRQIKIFRIVEPNEFYFEPEW